MSQPASGGAGRDGPRGAAPVGAAIASPATFRKKAPAAGDRFPPPPPTCAPSNPARLLMLLLGALFFVAGFAVVGVLLKVGARQPAHAPGLVQHHSALKLGAGGSCIACCSARRRSPAPTAPLRLRPPACRASAASGRSAGWCSSCAACLWCRGRVRRGAAGSGAVWPVGLVAPACLGGNSSGGLGGRWNARLAQTLTQPNPPSHPPRPRPAPQA